MRGAAKSLAPLPTAWMDNITGTTGYWLKAYSNTIPAIEAFFEFPHSSEKKVINELNHHLGKMADFRPGAVPSKLGGK